MLKKLKTRLFAPSQGNTARIETTRFISPDSEFVADRFDPVTRVSDSGGAPVSIESKQFEVGGLYMDNNEQSQNAIAVAEIFDSTKLFEDKFGKLLPAFEQVGHLGKDAVTAFESMKTLANNLERLTGAFEPLKCLQDQLAQVACSFDSVNSLQGRFAEVSNAFRNHLKHLIDTLQPAKGFHSRLVELAATFESASELQQRFERLAAAFEQGPRATPSNADGKTAAASTTASLV